VTFNLKNHVMKRGVHIGSGQFDFPKFWRYVRYWSIEPQ